MVNAPVTEKDGDAQLRVWWRHWGVVLILAVLAGLVIWAMLNLAPWLRNLQEWRAAKTAQEQIEKLYRNDKYGGKTPEETFDMFVSALEKGDIDLASKYFVLNKQEQWKKTLEEYKIKALLADFNSELLKNRVQWKRIETEDKNIIEYNYDVKVPENTTVEITGNKLELPAGEYTNIVIFEKYPSEIWKINLL